MGEELTEYERCRALVIARNRARLQALGVDVAAQDLGELTQSRPADDAPKATKAKPAKKKTKLAPQPTRRSKRLRNDGDAGSAPKEEELDPAATELAMFQIDGECPKCGKVFTRGHAKHLASCNGVQVEIPTLEELVQIEVAKVEKMDKKLSELEVGGLVDLDKDKVVFMVVGSTGKHYKVTISDEKRTCQCVDHRIRRHDCKHIKLMLQTMGVLDRASEWYAAAQRLVTSQASQAEATPSSAGDVAADARKANQSKPRSRRATKQQAQGQAFL